MYKGVDYSAPTASGVSGVKGAKENAYRVGNVNITPANIGALSVDGGTVTGEVLHAKMVVCENHGYYNDKANCGIGFKYDNSSDCITIPENTDGYGSYSIYDGLICPDNIDRGIIKYIARSNGNAEHDFYSIDNNGYFLGSAYIYEGEVHAKKYNTFGGDYAENWEYEDGNTGNEDRTGLFVTFKGNKIIISQKGDNLAKVGVVSATPSIVGDTDGKEWAHKYLKDVYGREIWQNVENEDGTVSKERVLNPEYDETLKYIKRKDRPEWDAVGTHGKLVVRDDGTCYEDGFCVPTDGGIATASENGFYVMERLDESHVRIYMK